MLETVFRENWRELLDAFDRIEASDEPPLAQLAGIAKVLLRAWRDRPDLVTVMVREVARSPQLQGQVDEIRAGFLVIQRVIERGQADGSFRPELDARLASWIFYGGLEELLTGWVLGQLPDGDEAVARAEQTVVEILCGGLTRAARSQCRPETLSAAERHAGPEEPERPELVARGRRTPSSRRVRAARGRRSRRTRAARARRRRR